MQLFWMYVFSLEISCFLQNSDNIFNPHPHAKADLPPQSEFGDAMQKL